MAKQKEISKSVPLNERENYLMQIGFTWDEESKCWISPHNTCKLPTNELLILKDIDYPSIFDYYKKTGEFSEELFDVICEQIATSSRSTRQVCKDNGITASSFYRWLQKDGEDAQKLRDKYARAKEDQVEFLVDEMLEIADDGSNDLMTITKGDVSYEIENKEVTNRSKLRIDTRKFIAAKLKAKKYGDKLDLTSDGEKMSQVVVFKLPDNGRDKTQ